MSAQTLSFARRLNSWYRRHARDLPWRQTQDPYKIWISEVMLQQTTVTAVIPYYEMDPSLSGHTVRGRDRRTGDP